MCSKLQANWQHWASTSRKPSLPLRNRCWAASGSSHSPTRPRQPSVMPCPGMEFFLLPASFSLTWIRHKVSCSCRLPRIHPTLWPTAPLPLVPIRSRAAGRFALRPRNKRSGWIKISSCLRSKSNRAGEGQMILSAATVLSLAFPSPQPNQAALANPLALRSRRLVTILKHNRRRSPTSGSADLRARARSRRMDSAACFGRSGNDTDIWHMNGCGPV